MVFLQAIVANVRGNIFSSAVEVRVGEVIIVLWSTWQVSKESTPPIPGDR